MDSGMVARADLCFTCLRKRTYERIASAGSLRARYAFWLLGLMIFSPAATTSKRVASIGFIFVASLRLTRLHAEIVAVTF